MHTISSFLFVLRIHDSRPLQRPSHAAAWIVDTLVGRAKRAVFSNNAVVEVGRMPCLLEACIKSVSDLDPASWTASICPRTGKITDLVVVGSARPLISQSLGSLLLMRGCKLGPQARGVGDLEPYNARFESQQLWAIRNHGAVPGPE